MLLLDTFYQNVLNTCIQERCLFSCSVLCSEILFFLCNVSSLFCCFVLWQSNVFAVWIYWNVFVVQSITRLDEGSDESDCICIVPTPHLYENILSLFVWLSWYINCLLDQHKKCRLAIDTTSEKLQNVKGGKDNLPKQGKILCTVTTHQTSFSVLQKYHSYYCTCIKIEYVCCQMLSPKSVFSKSWWKHWWWRRLQYEKVVHKKLRITFLLLLHHMHVFKLYLLILLLCRCGFMFYLTSFWKLTEPSRD